MSVYSTAAIFHISLDFWGIILCLTASFGVVFIKNQNSTAQLCKIMMQISCLLLLGSDLMAWGGTMMTGPLSYTLVQVGSFGVYLLNILYIAVFTYYVWCNMRTSPRQKPFVPLHAAFALSAVGIVMTVVNLFTGILYTVSPQKHLVRGALYPVLQILSFGAVIMMFVAVWQNRDRLTRKFIVSISLFVVPPVAATVASFINPNLALQNVAIAIATQLMFTLDLIEVTQELKTSRSAYQEASFAASHDNATGLWNKASGIEQMRQYLASMGENDNATMIFVDIDDFKKVNDVYGHMAGDQWIKTVASLLQSNCREQDIVSRFGGDEFVLLLKGTADGDAMRLKVRMFADAMHQKALAAGQDVHCSAGLCLISGTGHELKTCMETADAALYEAKTSGIKPSCAVRRLGDSLGEKLTGQGVGTPSSISLQLVSHSAMAVFSMIVLVDFTANSYMMLKEGACAQMHLSSRGKYRSGVATLLQLLAEEDRMRMGRLLAPEHLQGLSAPESTLCHTQQGQKLLVTVIPAEENLTSSHALVLVQEPGCTE